MLKLLNNDTIHVPCKLCHHDAIFSPDTHSPGSVLLVLLLGKGSFHVKGDILCFWFFFLLSFTCSCAWIISSKVKMVQVHTNRSSSLPQKHCSWNASSAVSQLSDIWLHHYVTHLHNLCLAVWEMNLAQLLCFCKRCWLRRSCADQSEQTG